MRGQRQRASRGRGDARWLVVVESPAKARTVGRFLGRGWRVLACHGHVRDLPAKAGSGEARRRLRDGLRDRGLLLSVEN